MEHDRRTRSYRGTYTDKNGKRNNVTIRVFKGLAGAVLAITLVRTAGCAIIKTGETIIDTFGTGQEDQQVDYNIELINSILQKNPHMLETVEIIDYTVGADTLSSIAARFGTSVKRLQDLNNIENPNKINFQQEIRVEKVTPLSEVDQEIKILETYLFDYLLSSKPSQMAREETKSPAANLCYSIIYGNPSDPAVIDPSSIYGRAKMTYGDFHSDEIDHSLEEVSEQAKKEQYVSDLSEIVNDLLKNNDILDLVDYEQFKIYCKNGHTKSNELVQEDVRARIYGN